ncbi:hypothetical protein [Cardiobacterium hominis]|uniref:hypothetical protein n=1 Tax=Cardiobacterium hominis TaxID=2718 RepID=UPI0028D79EEA|nr:hypothetical protein [Cardiobacterium hominis]
MVNPNPRGVNDLPIEIAVLLKLKNVPITPVARVTKDEPRPIQSLKPNSLFSSIASTKNCATPEAPLTIPANELPKAPPISATKFTAWIANFPFLLQPVLILAPTKLPSAFIILPDLAISSGISRNTSYLVGYPAIFISF